MKDRALNMALEALEIVKLHYTQNRHVNEAIIAIEEALAQPVQEPVAWGVFEGNLHDMFFSQAYAEHIALLKGSHAEVRPLYTHPPQRPWVDLTEHELFSIWMMVPDKTEDRFAFARAVLTKSKERNT
jgi:hypothetical protein